MARASKKIFTTPQKGIKAAPTRRASDRAPSSETVCSSSTEDDVAEVPRRTRATRAHTTKTPTGVRATDVPDRDHSVTIVADEGDTVTITGRSRSPTMRTRRSSLQDIILSLDDYVDINSDEDSDAGERCVSALTGGCGPGGTMAAHQAAHTPRNSFSERDLAETAARLLDRLSSAAADHGARGVPTTATHNNMSTSTLITRLASAKGAHAFFTEGFQLAKTASMTASDTEEEAACPHDQASLMSPLRKRSRSGSRRGAQKTGGTPKEYARDARTEAVAGESFLDPASTSLFRTDMEVPAVVGVTSLGESDANELAAYSLGVFLREELLRCYDAEDAVIEAQRRREVQTECQQSLVAQQLYRQQHPPPPRDALCLTTGKRRRDNVSETERIADEARADTASSISVFEADCGVCPRPTAPTARMNPFDIMATRARLAARRPGPQQQQDGDGALSREETLVGDRAPLTASTVRSLQHHVQAFYRDQWKLRQAAQSEEDAARGMRRLHEMPLLIEDACHYAHHVVSFQSAAALSSSVAVSSPTPTSVGPVVYGDRAVALYGRYPPPFFRGTPFTVETVRLLKWLRTWRRRGQHDALPASPRRAAGASHGSPRSSALHSRDLPQPAPHHTEPAKVRIVSEVKGEEQGEKVRATVMAPTPGTTDVPVSSEQQQKHTKQKMFLSFFGAAAKVPKVEVQPVTKDEALVGVKKETEETIVVGAAGVPNTPHFPSEPVGVCSDNADALANPQVTALTTMTAAHELYKRRWQQAVRHPSSLSAYAFTHSAGATRAPPPPPPGAVSSMFTPPAQPASRTARSLPFFAEMVEEQQDGVLLGSTREVYCDAFGNRLRSARLAQKEIERRVAEEVSRRKLEKKKGYFSREDGNRCGGAGGTGGTSDALDLLLSRRLQEEARLEQARRRRRRRRARGEALLAKSRSSSTSTQESDSDESSGSSSSSSSSGSSNGSHTSALSVESSGEDDNKGHPTLSVSARSHSVSSICTVSSSDSGAACSVNSQSSTDSNKKKTKTRAGREPEGKPSSRHRGRRDSVGARKATRTASGRKDHSHNNRSAENSGKAKHQQDKTENVGGGGEGDDITNIAVVSGPCGSGKTASVYLAAQLLGYRVVEMNASVRRSPKNVEHLLAELTRSYRLSGLQQGRSAVTVEEELSKLKREHEALMEKMKAEAAAAEEEAERKRKEARRANVISANAVAAFFKAKPKARASEVGDDVAEVVHVEDGSPARKTIESSLATTEKESTPPSASPSSHYTSTTGTLLLFEDADVLLEDEAFKPFYAAIRDLAHKSKVPIVVTVGTPATPLTSSNGAGLIGSTSHAAGASSRRSSLPLFAPRYPMQVAAFSPRALLPRVAENEEEEQTVLTNMEEADLRLVDELSSPSFMKATYTHVPFSSTAAASFFGRQTPFTQLALPSRATLFVHLLLIGAAELHGLHLVPEAAEAQTSASKAPLAKSLTDLCDRVMASSLSGSASAKTAATTASASSSPSHPSEHRVAQIRPGFLPLLRTLAARLRDALFGHRLPLTPAEGEVRAPPCDADEDGLDDAVLAEASTTDVRFWLGHLQMLLLTLPRSSAPSLPLSSDTHDELATTTAAAANANCEALSYWDRQRGRYHVCLADNDAQCPRQQCWELSALLDYEEDVVEELCTVHHPTRDIAYNLPSVFELAADETTQRNAKSKRTTASSSSATKAKAASSRFTAVTGKAPLVHAVDDNSKEDEKDIIMPSPPSAKGSKRGRGRPSKVELAASAAVSSSSSPSTGSASGTPKASMWMLFSASSKQSAGSCAVSPLSPPPSSSRRIEGASAVGFSSGSSRGAEGRLAQLSPSSPAATPSDGKEGTATTTRSLPSSMFADCAALFSPLPVELVLPYGATQRRLFPSRTSQTTSPAFLSDDHEARQQQSRWSALLAERPRAASVTGMTPSGGVVSESSLAVFTASPYVHVRDTHGASVAQRMAVLRRWWRRPRKADAAKKLVPGHGHDALEDLLGFATTLLTVPKN